MVGVRLPTGASYSSLTNRCDGGTDDGDTRPTDTASVTPEDLRTAVSVNTEPPYHKL